MAEGNGEERKQAIAQLRNSLASAVDRLKKQGAISEKEPSGKAMALMMAQEDLENMETLDPIKVRKIMFEALGHMRGVVKEHEDTQTRNKPKCVTLGMLMDMTMIVTTLNFYFSNNDK